MPYFLYLLLFALFWLAYLALIPIGYRLALRIMDSQPFRRLYWRTRAGYFAAAALIGPAVGIALVALYGLATGPLVDWMNANPPTRF